MDLTTLQAWLQALVRWAHVFAAILWIGQTWLFHVFERRLRPPTEEDDDNLGEAWMVHGGGFFGVSKRRFSGQEPADLRWFRWESGATWVSGFVLLLLTYYMGGLLVEPDASFGRAAAVGLGSLVVGWWVYDLLARSPLVRYPLLFGALGWCLLLALYWMFARSLSSRAAFLHVGAVMGTIMAANVWLRILPAQRRMLAAASAGEPIAEDLAAVGPLRSQHNTFLVMPLLFIMISNHYPTLTYAHSQAIWILGGVLLAGWGVAWLLQKTR